MIGDTILFDDYLTLTKQVAPVPSFWSWEVLSKKLGAIEHGERGSLTLTLPGQSKTVDMAPGISSCLQIVACSKQTRMHRHSFWHIYIVLEGFGVANLGNPMQSVEISPHDLFFVPSWCEHAFSASNERDLVLLAFQNMPKLAREGTLARCDETGVVEAVYSDGNVSLGGHE